MQKEIAPISDARGTADYKRLIVTSIIFGSFFKINSLIVETH